MGYQGVLLAESQNGAPGRIESDHGDIYTFLPHQIRDGEKLKVGTRVDFYVLTGEARDIFAIPDAKTAPRAPPPLKPAPVPASGSLWSYYKYALTGGLWQYKGRSRRQEFFSFAFLGLFVVIGAVMLDAVVSAVFNPAERLFGWLPQDKDGDGETEPYFLYITTLPVFLWHFLAGISVAVRRLHDTGRRSWSLVTLFIPYIGIVILASLLLLDSERGHNHFGESHKYPHG